MFGPPSGRQEDLQVVEEDIESMISPINASLMKAAAFKPGEQVVEVGSGGGKNVIEIAKAVAPSGRVLGVDVAEILIAHSKKRAAEAGVDNVELKCADAQTASLDAPRDRAFSSFVNDFLSFPLVNRVGKLVVCLCTTRVLG